MANNRYAERPHRPERRRPERRVKNATETLAKLHILSDCGDVIGFKKLQNNLIATILIEDGTPRSNATGRKCRAQRALVLSIDSDGKYYQTGISKQNSNFIYTVGEYVEVKDFDTDWKNECSTGIHFFITRAEAEAY